MRFLTWHYITQPSTDRNSQDTDATEHSPSLPRQTLRQLGSATDNSLSPAQNAKYLSPTAENKLGNQFWFNFNHILGIELQQFSPDLKYFLLGGSAWLHDSAQWLQVQQLPTSNFHHSNPSKTLLKKSASVKICRKIHTENAQLLAT